MISQNQRAFICGLKGYKITKSEKAFLIKYKPWGVILFSRNIKSIKQTQLLTQSLKTICKNPNLPILIDEEGGRVTRLKKFIDNSVFSAKYFGDLYSNDRKKFYIYYDVYVKQISYLLKLLGININTVPVLDLLRKKAHKIVGDRSFSFNKNIISKLGDICIEKFHKNKIGTIIKHIPGHGLAKADSHIKLPVINNNLNYLLKNDFGIFKEKKSIMAMTGHLLFNSIDKNDPVTHSKKLIKIIRKNIKFNGLIITDDLSMKALSKDIKNNVIKSFQAGCNLALHCNGKLNEMIVVAKNSPKIDNFIIKKTEQITNIIS